MPQHPLAFIPVISPRFPLDTLYLPYALRLCGKVLVSYSEWREHPLPNHPLWIDSGGFLALARENKVIIRADGTGELHTLNFNITPEQVWDFQMTAGAKAEVIFTLDFPGGEQETRRQRLEASVYNALWALKQPRSCKLYASVQPDQPAEHLQEIMRQAPDGIALGGLARERNHQNLRQQITRIKDIIPAHLPLHVFGIGHPEGIKLLRALGVSSSDSSSPQQHAAQSKVYGGKPLEDVSPHERIGLAVRNLHLIHQVAEQQS